MKNYEAPELFVDEYVADTMIASSGGGGPKNSNAGNNHNCWGFNCKKGEIGPDGDACLTGEFCI